MIIKKATQAHVIVSNLSNFGCVVSKVWSNIIYAKQIILSKCSKESIKLQITKQIYSLL